MPAIRLSIRGKLYALVTLLIALLVVGSVVGYRGVSAVQQQAKALDEKSVAKLFELVELQSKNLLMRSAMDQTASHKGDNRKHVSDFHRSYNDADSRLARLMEMSGDVPNQREALNQARERLHAIDAAFKEGAWTDDSKTFVERAAVGDRADALFGAYAKPLETFTTEVTRLAGERAEQAEHAANNAHRLLWLFGVLAAAAGIGAAWALSRSLLPRIGAYVAFAERVAGGDLTGRLDPKGSDQLTELATALNAMVENLSDLTGEITGTATSMNDAVERISGAVAEQRASASEQAAAITQTTTAVEEVRASAEQAAERAAGVHTSAEHAQVASAEGAQALQEMAVAMSDIRDRVQTIAGDIEQLSAHTSQIQDITTTVSDLADQSNLLALNATIEAARAGEQGKGFAVVADEVRNLAEQSKQATAQVREILTEIQAATAKAVAGAESGRQAADSGMELVSHSEQIISQLAESNQAAAQAATQIAAAASQQRVGMDQIAAAMTETDHAAQQLTHGAEQTREAAAQLAETADRLRGLVATFRTNA